MLFFTGVHSAWSQPPAEITVEVGATLRKEKRSGKAVWMAGGFKPNYIEVPQGQWVTLKLTSTEGSHSLRIPQYDLQTDEVSAGQTASLRFLADRPGDFEMTCASRCGPLHRRMRGNFVVTPPEGR